MDSKRLTCEINLGDVKKFYKVLNTQFEIDDYNLHIYNPECDEDYVIMKLEFKITSKEKITLSKLIKCILKNVDDIDFFNYELLIKSLQKVK